MDLISRIRQEYLGLKKKRGHVVLKDIGPPHLTHKALLHYKIDPLYDKSLQRKYYHTNNWEVPEIVRILNGLGYRVDVVDRSNKIWMPEDVYDLLISNASGDSGALYPVYADHAKRAFKIFYALGPEVNEANRRVLQRYTFLEERTGRKYPPMRVMKVVDVERCVGVSDAVFCLEDNRFSRSTYERFGLPMYSIFPSSSPRCHFDPEWIHCRDRKRFLCFSGDGFIAKGVDLLVEAFLQYSEAELIIAGPDSDKCFHEIYSDAISRAKNIHYEGFLMVGGRRFNELMGNCSYVILPAAAEGVATSVTTCMRAGLVPVVTYEAGVNAAGLGGYINSEKGEIIDDIIDKVEGLSKLSKSEYAERVAQTLTQAQSYSQASFSRSFSHALAACMAGTLCGRNKAQ